MVSTEAVLTAGHPAVPLVLLVWFVVLVVRMGVVGCVASCVRSAAAGAGGALAVLPGVEPVTGCPVPGHGGVVAVDSSCSVLGSGAGAVSGEAVAVHGAGVTGLGGGVTAVGGGVECVSDLVESVGDAVDVVDEGFALDGRGTGAQALLQVVQAAPEAVLLLQERGRAPLAGERVSVRGPVP